MHNILCNINSLLRYLSLVLLLFLCGCAEQRTVPMMPAPVIYHDTTIDPFSHLYPEERTTTVPVLYATNRKPQTRANTTPYSNEVSELLHLGEVHVRFGTTATNWKDLYLASTSPEQSSPLLISLEKTRELATIPCEEIYSGNLKLSPQIRNFIANVNKKLSRARDKEIIIYVHGAKGNFLQSVALTAEIDHFSGRDFVGIAFAWPSHQNIFSYINGIDRKRAQHSTSSLRTLIELLAEYTTVQQINIICYSAGGRLVSKAIDEMRHNHHSLNLQELKRAFKLGTILFTAADVSVDQFLERLPAISQIAQNVIITVSDADTALHFSSIVIGGNDRIGTREAEKNEKEFSEKSATSNFEIIDFSFGQQERGFDITGHHYWYRHPWASSDIIFLLRTDLPAAHRGLTASDIDGIWYLPLEYPSQVRKAIQKALKGQW